MTTNDRRFAACCTYSCGCVAYKSAKGEVFDYDPCFMHKTYLDDDSMTEGALLVLLEENFPGSFASVSTISSASGAASPAGRERSRGWLAKLAGMFP